MNYKFDEGKYKPSHVFESMIEAISKVREHGIEKYQSEDAWQKVSSRRYFDALGRHYYAIVSGEWEDQESGLPHLYHIACNIMFLIELEG